MDETGSLPHEGRDVARVFAETEALTARVNAALVVSRQLEAYLLPRST